MKAKYKVSYEKNNIAFGRDNKMKKHHKIIITVVI